MSAEQISQYPKSPEHGEREVVLMRPPEIFDSAPGIPVQTFNLGSVARSVYNYLGLNHYLKPQPAASKKAVMEAPRANDDLARVPNVSFEDIGGQEVAKATLRRLAFGMKQPEVYKQNGTRPPKGILLYGPPGTGKTMLAKALAHEAGAPFYKTDLDKLTDMYYGESEKKVRALFERADSHNKPAIVFIDEIDALAPKREFTTGGPTHRVISVLLDVLDGAVPLRYVTLVAATNHMEAIDEALLRPGRIDEKIPINLPDQKDLADILKMNCLQAEAIAEKQLFDALDVELIVQNMTDFSGADASEIVRRTLDKRLDMALENKQNNSLVGTDELLAELRSFNKKPEITSYPNRVGFRGSTK